MAILVRKNIIFDVLNWELESNSWEIGVIVVCTNLGDIVIVVCYRSPIQGNDLNANDLKLLTNEISKYKNFLLMGDFIAHHFLWGSNKCCKNGETLAEVLDLDEFFLLTILIQHITTTIMMRNL